MATVVGLFLLAVGCLCLAYRGLGEPDRRVFPVWGPMDGAQAVDTVREDDGV